MDNQTYYPCPCCGYMTLNAKPPGTYLICPICFWEDDQGAFGQYFDWGGSNQVTLRQAQRNFLEFGACERLWLNDVRRPTSIDVLYPNWQTIDAVAEMSRVALINQIIDAFENVTLEDGISLHEALALDAYGDSQLARQVDCTVQWQNVPEQWLERFDVFPFFDPKGFRHYIPAYMIWCLNHYETSNSNSLHSLLYALKQGEGYYSTHFELLNEAQLQAISAFLQFMDIYTD